MLFNTPLFLLFFTMFFVLYSFVFVKRMPRDTAALEEAFDSTAAAGIESISYNIGVGGLNPEYQLLVAKRMRDQILAAGGKVDLMLIEFNPFQTTLARKQGDAFQSDQRYASFSTFGELIDIALEDPRRGIRLLEIKYLRRAVSAELLTGVLGQIVGGLNQAPPAADTRELRREVGEGFNDINRRFLQETGKGYGWSWIPEARGGRFDADAISPETLDRLTELEVLRNDPRLVRQALERRIACCDILELGFDEDLVRAFIQLVRELQTVSHRVDVILLPQNHFHVTNPPAARQRLETILERIRRETGARITNYQRHPAIEEGHFVDASHLSSVVGASIFSRELARDYADYLAKQDE